MLYSVYYGLESAWATGSILLIEKFIKSRAFVHAMGKIKGSAFLEDLPYIKWKKGQEGVVSLEKDLLASGFPVRFSDIQDRELYPVEHRILFLKALVKMFKWDDRKIYEMAKAAPKAPTAQKFFIRYFISVDNAFKMAGQYWDNYFDFGKLVSREYDRQNRTMFLDLQGFDVDPIMYTQLSGYFAGVGTLTGIKNSQCEVLPEKKTAKGASRSFKLTWE